MSTSRRGATSARWVVACGAYRTPPMRSRAVAERRLVAIVDAGNCTAGPHRVEEAK